MGSGTEEGVDVSRFGGLQTLAIGLSLRERGSGARRLDRIAPGAVALLLLAGVVGMLTSCATPAATTPPAPPSATAGSAATPPPVSPDRSPSAPTARPTDTTQPEPTSSPSPVARPSPVPSATTASTAKAASGDVGYLEGRASIGPLTPVERVGVPTPTPSPQVCTARGLAIDAADGKTPVTSFNLRPDCTYRVALAPGQYVVRLKSGGFGFSKDLPKTVTIQRGQTTRLDIHIDTGIR